MDAFQSENCKSYEFFCFCCRKKEYKFWKRKSCNFDYTRLYSIHLLVTLIFLFICFSMSLFSFRCLSFFSYLSFLLLSLPPSLYFHFSYFFFIFVFWKYKERRSIEGFFFKLVKVKWYLSTGVLFLCQPLSVIKIHPDSTYIMDILV